MFQYLPMALDSSSDKTLVGRILEASSRIMCLDPRLVSPQRNHNNRSGFKNRTIQTFKLRTTLWTLKTMRYSLLTLLNKSRSPRRDPQLLEENPCPKGWVNLNQYRTSICSRRLKTTNWGCNTIRTQVTMKAMDTTNLPLTSSHRRPTTTTSHLISRSKMGTAC